MKNVAAFLSQEKVMSRNRSRQSGLTVSHTAFNLFLLLIFMNLGEKGALLFSSVPLQ